MPQAKIPVGVSTVLGVLAALGTVAAAIKGNDPATIVAGIMTIVTMLGRYAQAVALVREVAIVALPVVEELSRLSVEPREPGSSESSG